MCSISILFLALAFTLTLVSARPYPLLPSLSSFHKAAVQPVSDSIEKVAFKVPCKGCSVSGDDAALDFEIHHPRFSSSTNLCAVPFTLNGQLITGDHNSFLQVSHDYGTVDLTVQTFCTEETLANPISSQRAFFFNLTGIDGAPIEQPDTFITVAVAHSEPVQVLINSEADDQTNCASALASVVDETSSLFTQIEAIPEDNDLTSVTNIDFVEQQFRRRLHDQATRLQQLSKDCRNNSRQSLADCDRDISCLARVMCQRIHDTTLSKIAEIQKSLQDSAMVSKNRHDQYIVADEHDEWEFNVTSVDALLSGINKEKESKKHDDSQHPLVLALEILAAAIGLTALCAFLRRRFGSLRRRVERLADKEERKRACQFRLLARREAIRKRWVSFKGVFKRKSRNGDDEEKRALVIEIAGAVVDDYAEASFNRRTDPEMGDTLGDLHSAHAFVAGLVSGGRARKFSDAASGHTSLPEYTEEKLPDYTSNPDSEPGIANGFRYAPSIAGSGSVNTAITPESSIVLTPRCSRETLRTGTEFSFD